MTPIRSPGATTSEMPLSTTWPERSRTSLVALRVEAGTEPAGRWGRNDLLLLLLKPRFQDDRSLTPRSHDIPSDRSTFRVPPYLRGLAAYRLRRGARNRGAGVPRGRECLQQTSSARGKPTRHSLLAVFGLFGKNGGKLGSIAHAVILVTIVHEQVDSGR